MKRCSKCKENKDIKAFSVTKRSQDGSIKYRNSWCNSCRTEGNRIREGHTKRNTGYVGKNEKECLHCRKTKSLEQFHPSLRNKRGLGKSSYCKECQKERYYDKEKAKHYTYEYRSRHRERYLSNHRLHQFKRRGLIDVNNDGTVNDDFLKNVYAKEICYWCECFVEPSDRTLEHIEELVSGGEHSTKNITMACRSCNSSRKNRRT